jgi:hypothetical protein
MGSRMADALLGYEENRLPQKIERLRHGWAQTDRVRVARLPPMPDHVCLISYTSGQHAGLAMPVRDELHRESALELCISCVATNF